MFDFDPSGIGPEDLDRLAKETQEAMRRLDGAMDDLSEVTGEGEAADGMIQATVDRAGGLTNVTLNPRVMRLGSETLAEEFTIAVRVAQEDVRRKVQELLGQALGVDSLSPSMVDRDRIKEQFKRIEESFAGRVDAYEKLRRPAD